MPTALRQSCCPLFRHHMPVSVGAGFIALDILLMGKHRVKANEEYAGGSCGNVLSILAHLEWSSYPVARLGNDRLAQIVLNDFRQSGVRTEFILQSDTGVTPVVIVRIAERRDGTIGPRFEWKHPESGDWLPRYRPFPKTIAEEVTPALPTAGVFYFDRAEPSTLVMAAAMRERGAVVFFEPSSCKDDPLFTSCLAVSDIVKHWRIEFRERRATPCQNRRALRSKRSASSGCATA